MLRVHIRVVLFAILIAASTVIVQTELRAEASESESIRFADPVLIALDEPDAFDSESSSVKSGDVVFDAGLHYRLWGDGLFGEGDESQALFQRLRADVSLQVGVFDAVFGLDALAGRIAGDSYVSVPSHIESGAVPYAGIVTDSTSVLDPREMYGGWLSPVGQFRLGLQASDWGLGVIANSGATSQERLFGQTFGGDRSFRLLYATTPLMAFSDSYLAQNTFLVLGGDVVYRDENASYDRGDRAYQGLMSLFFEDAQTTLGGYMAYRAQTDISGDELDVLALDLHAERVWYGDEATWKFRTAGEIAFLTGSTTRAFAPDASPMSVRGLGVAGEFEVVHKPSELGMNVLLGFASGDADASDDTLYRFRFDPNYKVGLVLFDHYLPAISREGFVRATDPEKSGYPPKGVEQLIETGAVANAYYFNPQIQYGQDMGFMGGVGALFARSDVPVYDPYDTLVGGGTLRGARGRAKADTDLGWELNAVAQYRYRLASQLVLEARAEYGILFPGAAFDDAEGRADDAQSLLRARFGVRW